MEPNIKTVEINDENNLLQNKMLKWEAFFLAFVERVPLGNALYADIHKLKYKYYQIFSNSDKEQIYEQEGNLWRECVESEEGSEEGSEEESEGNNNIMDPIDLIKKPCEEKNHTTDNSTEGEEELMVIIMDDEYGKEREYLTNDEQNGDIFAMLENDEVGERLGKFENGEPKMYDEC